MTNAFPVFHRIALMTCGLPTVAFLLAYPTVDAQGIHGDSVSLGAPFTSAHALRSDSGYAFRELSWGGILANLLVGLVVLLLLLIVAKIIDRVFAGQLAEMRSRRIVAEYGLMAVVVAASVGFALYVRHCLGAM